jgi:hypothetical protein
MYAAMAMQNEATRQTPREARNAVRRRRIGM